VRHDREALGREALRGRDHVRDLGPVDVGDVDPGAGGRSARKLSTFSAVRGMTSIDQPDRKAGVASDGGAPGLRRRKGRRDIRVSRRDRGVTPGRGCR
jgi:hypothetical protein